MLVWASRGWRPISFPWAFHHRALWPLLLVVLLAGVVNLETRNPETKSDVRFQVPPFFPRCATVSVAMDPINGANPYAGGGMDGYDQNDPVRCFFFFFFFFFFFPDGVAVDRISIQHTGDFYFT